MHMKKKTKIQTCVQFFNLFFRWQWFIIQSNIHLKNGQNNTLTSVHFEYDRNGVNYLNRAFGRFEIEWMLP